MIYYIYKIILTEGSLKDHYYIGQRKYKGTEISNDRYKGSGDIIKKYYKKYPNNYIKQILEICGDAKSLNKAEERWIGDKYETDPLCLNLRAGGGGGYISKAVYSRFKIEYIGHYVSEETRQKIRQKSTGRKASEESRRKMSLSRKGKHFLNRDFSGSKNPNAKAIYQIDENGNIIKKWDTGREASLYYHKSLSCVNTACRKQVKALSFYWAFVENFNKDDFYQNVICKKKKAKYVKPRIKIIIKCSNNELQKEKPYRGIIKNKIIINLDSKKEKRALKAAKNSPRSKVTLQYSLQGEFIQEWPSAGTPAKLYGITRGNIHECCKGNRKSAGGFIWKYKTN